MFVSKTITGKEEQKRSNILICRPGNLLTILLGSSVTVEIVFVSMN